MSYLVGVALWCQFLHRCVNRGLLHLVNAMFALFGNRLLGIRVGPFVGCPVEWGNWGGSFCPHLAPRFMGFFCHFFLPLVALLGGQVSGSPFLFRVISEWLHLGMVEMTLSLKWISRLLNGLGSW